MCQLCLTFSPKTVWNVQLQVCVVCLCPLLIFSPLFVSSSLSLLILCCCTDMESNSSLNSPYFELTLFAEFGPLRYLFFSLCLLVYLTIICANVVIVVTLCVEKSLHQPMYIFICCLSVNSLYGSAAFFPRFLMDILSDTHLISRQSCLFQIYLIYTYVGQELTLLVVMAYDRFVAICQPLHYPRKMTAHIVRQFLVFIVLFPACAVSLLVYITSCIPFCGNKLHRLFCTNWPLIQLFCEKMNLNNFSGLSFTVTSLVVPLSFVLYTYLRILLVCRRSSSDLKRKALQTCLPHIITFMNYIFSLFCDLSLTRIDTDGKNSIITIVLSLEYMIIPPISNPLVYGLNLPQIKVAMFKILKRHKLFFYTLQLKMQYAQKAADKAGSL